MNTKQSLHEEHNYWYIDMDQNMQVLGHEFVYFDFITTKAIIILTGCYNII